MYKTKIKVLYILDVLQRYTDIAHKLTADEVCNILRNEYNVVTERKSIYRDIETLTEYGVDIRTTSTGFFMGRRKLMLPEAKLLISGIRSAKFISAEKTALLSEKILSMFSVYQREKICEDYTNDSIKTTNEEVYHTIEEINNAILERKKLSFAYYKKNIYKVDEEQHNGARYIVSPYAAVCSSNNYYLICNVDNHDNVAQFRIDRMKNVLMEKVAWRHFSEVSDYVTYFDTEDYMQKCINMFGGKEELVRLRCKNERINEVLERFGSDIPIRQEDDKHFITAIKVAVSDGLVSWITQYCDAIEVLAPESLRERVRSKLNVAIKMYV